MVNTLTKQSLAPVATGIAYGQTVRVPALSDAPVPGSAAYDLAAVAGLPELPVMEYSETVDFGALPDCSDVFGCASRMDFLPSILTSVETTNAPVTVRAKL